LRRPVAGNAGNVFRPAPSLRPIHCAALACLSLLTAAAAPASATTRTAADTAAVQHSARVTHARTFSLPAGTTHLALHWRGPRTARVWIRLLRGARAGHLTRVALDELGRAKRGEDTYGAVMLARGARRVQVLVERPLRVSVLAMRDEGARPAPAANAASVSQPAIVLRSGWGADESLRFDSSGKEIWPPAFYPVQKLIVHHTATQNDDPDPAATVRAIYYYHAVTEGWGDIGYNFLIDEQGRIYEGRHSVDPPSPSPPGEDARGFGVTAAHAYGFNSGTVGIALLGTLTDRDATPAARHALEQLLAWEADRHGIAPEGSSTYTNPVSGAQATFPNIAGHRDVNSTECPGGAFYATLPTIRSDVAAMLAGSPSTSSAPTARTGAATGITKTAATLNGTIAPNGGFTRWRFDYGRTTAYGSSTPVASAGSGTATVAEAATVSGLRRATTYHFRIVAIDAAGVAYPAADATFRTRK
jgi:hypothetical protein